MSILLHAGAAESWHFEKETHEQIIVFLNAIVQDAQIALQSGLTAVDIVADVTAALEDYPAFNAGKGSAINIQGFHEV